MQVISKPRRKLLSIESASARPICERCKQSSAFPTAKKTKPSSNSTATGFALGIYRKHWMKAHFSTGLWACWADWMEADEEEAQTNGQLAQASVGEKKEK